MNSIDTQADIKAMMRIFPSPPALCTEASPTSRRLPSDARRRRQTAPVDPGFTALPNEQPGAAARPRARTWAIVAGTVVFFGIYLGVTAYREGLFDASGASAEQAAKEQREKVDVVRVLPMGRTLLRMAALCGGHV